ncbi:MAG TPA: DNA methyltransferase [Bacillota bacterium]|nr:DNA methyltransferase [Bacillota bacterium]
MDLLSLKQQISEMKPTNRHPLYASHLYWSQKPYNICELLIKSLTNESDIVLDPFMGSGVTVVEAVLLGRKGVGVEINELPIFIVDTILHHLQDPSLVESVLHDFAGLLERLKVNYETWSDECNEVGIIKKVIFDRESPFAEPCITEVHYQCKGKTYTKKPDLFDIQNMMVSKKFTQFKNYTMVANSRIAVQKNQEISTLFTPRALNTIDEILEYMSAIQEEELRNIIKYILMGSLHLMKITDLKSNSQWPLWTPKKDCLEKNAIDVLLKRIHLFHETYRYIREANPSIRKGYSFSDLKDGADFYVVHKGTQHLTQDDLPYQSVDLVITDPPYLGQVLYSEYMQLYYPFVGLQFNLEDEIVVSTAEGRGKDEQMYFDLLHRSFQNVSKKLKDGKLLCMYFHDSHLSVWNKLIRIMNENGLSFLTQIHIAKKVTLKNILSPKKSLQGDSILFFIKNTTVEQASEQTETLDEIVQNVILHIQEELKNKGPLTTPQLMDDGLMEYMIQNGWLESLSIHYKDIVELLEPHIAWNEKLGKWYVET